MPRFSIEENSSSSDDDAANRLPKRRRIPFPSRVLYRHGTSSTTPSSAAAATVITARARLISRNTTPAAGAAGASTSQPDSDESVESSDYDEDDDGEEEEAEIVAPIPAVVSRAVAIGRNSTVGNLNKAASNDVVRSGSTSDRIPAMISDTDVFDCAICFEPFTIPVYQPFMEHLLLVF